jgi:hypothetical protein
MTSVISWKHPNENNGQTEKIQPEVDAGERRLMLARNLGVRRSKTSISATFASD